MIDRKVHCWSVFGPEGLTDQHFSNAPCASATAVGIVGGGIYHPRFGQYESDQVRSIALIPTQYKGQISEAYAGWLDGQELRITLANSAIRTV